MANTNPQHTFKGLKDWIEVFRAGDHVDSKGRPCSFTQADLDQMVTNAVANAPPAVLGHPKHNDPAYAWGREVKRDGDSLFVKFADVNPAFEAGVDSGAYRNRSVSIVKDKAAGWMVRHVGWLGAAPPAIEGLTPLDYTADANADAHEFAADDSMTMSWALGDVASVLRKLRDWLISKEGLDAADAALPDWSITSISSAATQLREASISASASLYTANPNANPGDPTMAITEQDLQRARDEATASANAAAAVQFAAQGAELSELRAARQSERIGVQINGWKAAGLLLPAEEPGLAEFMAGLEAGPAEFAFTAADKAQVKKAPAAYFAEFMAARKAVVKLGVVASAADDLGNVPPCSNQEVAERAQQYMAQRSAAGFSISYSQAVDAVNAGKDKE